MSLAAGWLVNAPGRRRRLDLAEVVANRELIWFFVVRDLKVRYKQAALGVLWAVVQPAAAALLFSLVFGRLARLPSDGVPYLAFAFAGLALWSYFSSALANATASLVANTALVTKVYFPRVIAPLAAVLPGLLDLGVALVILAGVAALTGVPATAAVLALPLVVLATVALAFGAGVGLATLNVEYRDVGNVIGLLIQLWLFASPVAYPSSLIEGGWRYLYAVNPLVGILDAFRWSTLGAPAPGLPLLVSSAALLVVLVVGCRCFAGSERRFADVI